MSDPQPAAELDVLLVEDNEGDARLIEELFRDAEGLLQRIDGDTAAAGNIDVHHEMRLAPGLDRLESTEIDVVLLDLGLPDSTGLDTLAAVVDATEFLPIVVLTGMRDKQVGIEAIERGAQDYLVKNDVTSDRLVRAIHHAIERNRQERERAHQRQQLEALNVLTRDLMEAGIAAEVSQCVVDEADALLDLPITAVALYDDREAALELAGSTSPATKALDASSLLDRRDGAAWRAFTESDRRRLGPADADAVDGSAVSELAIVPLAGHGVLVTGSTEPDGFEDADVDFVETVAGNVETALDRVDRERRLHEREQQLDEQNRRLERLNDINTIIRSIARGLVEASTRQEVDRVVCEHLAGTGPYELAWIGDHDVVSDEIVRRESVGPDDGLFEATVRSTDGAHRSKSLAARAVQTRETAVENNLAADPPFEPWRKVALERGYRAGIAVPLVYQDVLYGVLTLYASEVDVFDGMEEAVLSELGRTIGYALNALQQQQALVSEQSVELEFRLRAGTPPLFRFAAEHDCEIAFEDVVQRGDGPPSMFFTIRRVSPEVVLDFGDQSANIEQLTLVSDGQGEALFEVELRESAFFSAMLARGAVPRTLTASGETGSAVIRVPGTSDIRTYVELFEEQYEDVELVGRRELDEPLTVRSAFDEEYRSRLTERQEEILRTAYATGFFESPRETTAQELADLLGISQPTASGHIREGERKLFDLLFDEE
jgi:DNA-binding NarL/FixJ family response regulator/GAF domain-containing protein/DNA-binding CsgD family transcriptional regulator